MKIRPLTTPEKKNVCISQSITIEPKVRSPWELWKQIHLPLVLPTTDHTGLKADAKISRNIWKATTEIKQTEPSKSSNTKLQKHI